MFKIKGTFNVPAQQITGKGKIANVLFTIFLKGDDKEYYNSRNGYGQSVRGADAELKT